MDDVVPYPPKSCQERVIVSESSKMLVQPFGFHGPQLSVFASVETTLSPLPRLFVDYSTTFHCKTTRALVQTLAAGFETKGHLTKLESFDEVEEACQEYELN
ncbi:hypothetical protein KIN20_029624 [Parelaphostrongylus tenuis]|uniref:Uncharacterized protein n=1 Tax=Parelaphostrongylus tenuis TaxID=148309 RepID=A0AAD5R2N5_PARTN|nr:hypothetical protein KIN20_029624 [Parelaphostrongylus tenuis]